MGSKASRTATELDAAVGGIMRAEREDRGWSLRRLARETGIGHSQIPRLEAGERSMTLREFGVLCETFELQPDRVIRFALTPGHPNHLDDATRDRLLGANPDHAIEPDTG